MGVADARPRLVQRCAAAGQLACGLFRLRQGIARRTNLMLGLAPGLARLPLGLGALAHRGFGARQRLLGGPHEKRRFDRLGIELGKPVLLGKALCRRGRRIGTGGQPVPAPQRALAADQPLARRKTAAGVLRPSAASTTPIWASRRASCVGARTTSARLRTPSGRPGSPARRLGIAPMDRARQDRARPRDRRRGQHRGLSRNRDRRRSARARPERHRPRRR